MDRLSGNRNADPKQNGSRPRYEIRAKSTKKDGLEISVWQLPSPSAPRLTEPECAGTLKGRPLRLVETAVIKRLRSLGISLAKLKTGETLKHAVDEEEAVSLALQFRALAPMRSVDRIQTVSDGIGRLSREEANYWLGMALHRKKPRRVLAALRMLLTSP